LLIDEGQPVEQVAELLATTVRSCTGHYRHRVRPIVDAAVGPMQATFGDGD
jgi:hypothetical protein